MLSPADRALYTEALTPPAGMRLDFAVGTAYSLDLSVLLAVPLHLALSASEASGEMMDDPVIVYESLQQVASRMRIYVQAGGIHAPTQGHSLFSLLEPVIIEVSAPNGGVFHPKLWALRFADDAGNLSYRLVVSSRNITADKSWDLALTLEGTLGARVSRRNTALAELIRKLPDLGRTGEDPDVDAMGRDLHRMEWEWPPGFSRGKFHVLGLGGKPWRPKTNEALLVISPFVSATALGQLAETSDKPMALVSRSQSLADLGKSAPFDRSLCLHEAAETDDSEEQDDETELGLHAKAYIYKKDKSVYVTMGSANATNAALVAGKNVELLVEMRGGTPQLGGPARLLDVNDGSLGQLLTQWNPEDTEPTSTDELARQLQLEAARMSLLNAGLRLECRQQDEHWQLVLVPSRAVVLTGITQVKAWPVSLKRSNAAAAEALADGAEVLLPVRAIASLTSIVAFSLHIGDATLTFSLNLPINGLPEGRDDALLQQIVSTRSGFLKYLLLLLAGLGDGADIGTVARALATPGFARFHANANGYPLLEELIRAFCRDPARLKRIRSLVDRLKRNGAGASVLPDGFLEFWQSFEAAIDDGLEDAAG